MFVRRTLFICAVMMAMASAFKLQASASAQVRAQTPAQAGAAGQTSSLSGSVADTQGGVIANAEVALSVWTPAMPGMKMTPAPSRTTRSTGNGTFGFDQVPAGQYVLQVDAPGFARSSQEITVPSTQALSVKLDVLEVPGAETVARPAGAQGTSDTQALLDRIKTLEQRVNDLESSTVLSEPETRTKRIEVYVDKNGNEYDHPVEGAKKAVTFQRERVYRRQTINEKIEGALSDQEKRSVKLGVSGAIMPQFAIRTRGNRTDADGHAYELANADFFFTARVAQHTMFFADLVGISGTPPDGEVPTLTLLNSFTARLVRQNELNVREAWLRTDLFSQKLAISAGRLDLTNYFDRNAVANDETTAFLSDSLVNNPSLGLAVNGTGVVAVYDPKKSLYFKIGLQQSNPAAKNLSESIYSLAEIGYRANPLGLGEGNYRLWYRVNDTGPGHRTAFGISADQRVSPTVTFFGRYGDAQPSPAYPAYTGRDRFYSGGLQIHNQLVVNPGDAWSFGFTQSDLVTGERERLGEGYYRFQLSERLSLSFHLTHVIEERAGQPKLGFLIPGIRLQASF